MPFLTIDPDSSSDIGSPNAAGTIGPDGVFFADDGPPPETPADICSDLLRLLAGCCHPRAERLRAQMDASPHPSARQIDNLRDEVLRLLTVCFGPAEARRQMDELTRQT